MPTLPDDCGHVSSHVGMAATMSLKKCFQYFKILGWFVFLHDEDAVVTMLSEVTLEQETHNLLCESKTSE
jgi:hypothetical protein